MNVAILIVGILTLIATITIPLFLHRKNLKINLPKCDVSILSQNEVPAYYSSVAKRILVDIELINQNNYPLVISSIVLVIDNKSHTATNYIGHLITAATITPKLKTVVNCYFQPVMGTGFLYVYTDRGNFQKEVTVNPQTLQ